MDVDEEQPEEIRFRTFKLENEDHTMGNLLTYILQQMPETEFCAYSVIHPTKNEIHIRLKVKNGHNVVKVFEEGVTKLKKALEIVESKFVTALDTFKVEIAKKAKSSHQ